MSVGNEIRKYLSSKGITQAHVARETGIKRSKLNQGLNGTRKISLEEYVLICECLGVPTGTFIETGKTA